MKLTLDLDGSIAKTIEDKVNEKIPEIIEGIIQDNIDEIIKDIVLKQLKGCALIYIQGPDFRAKLMDKVKPKVNEVVGV